MAVLSAIIVVATTATYFFRRSHSTRLLPPQLTLGAAGRFNVLLLTLDTTRPDHIGCYGYSGARTPVLDGLAEEGIRFADAVVETPSTLPSHTTMLTGLIPPHHGVRNNGQYYLEQDKTTLAEVLRAHDYETAAFTSAFVLDSRYGLNQGFDLYDDNIGKAHSMVFSENANQRSGADVTNSFLHWLETRDQSRRFFSWVHYYDPHAPYRPPSPFAEEFAGRPYDGEIAYTDSQIGRLLQALEEKGLRQNTLIMVASDHGDGMGDHGESTHARFIYESVMHGVLILACPGLFQGPYVVDDALVCTADIFPTIIELLGIKDAPAVDGISLLHAATMHNRLVYMDSIAPYLENGWSPLYGLRRHTDKYILAPRPEYYDLVKDPGELHNIYESVSGAQRQACDELVQALADRLAAGPPLGDVVAAAGQPDPEALRRLQSLGYVGTKNVDGSESELPDPKDMIKVVTDLNEAQTLIENGQYEQGLALVKKLTALSDCDHDVLHQMGIAYLRLGREDDAEQAFLSANQCRPDVDSFLLLGQIQIKQHRFDEAGEMLDQAAALDPLHGGIDIARGDLLALQRHPRDAIKAYERAEQVDPYRVGFAAEARIARVRQAFPRLTNP